MNNLKKLLIETWFFFKGNISGICAVIMPFIIPLTILDSAFEYFFQEEMGAVYWLFFFVGVVVYPIYQGAMILYLASVVTDEYLPKSQYYRLAIRSWVPLMVLYILVSLALMAGFLLLVIPGVVVMGRTVFSEFYCLFQSKSGIDSFAESWKATKRTQWILIGGIIVISICTSLPVYGIEYILEYVELSNPVFSFSINIVGSVLTTLFTIFAFRVYTLEVDQFNKSNQRNIVKSMS